MSSLIYLDNNATTKPDPRVVDTMIPYLSSEYANASSSHSFGEKIKRDVDQAREKVVQLIGGYPNELTFTSGATEALNIAIKGIAEASINGNNHIITIESEHPAVLDTCKYLETIGYEVTYLPVDTDGLVSLDTLKANLREKTILVSVMMVNNETGVIQPIKKIAEIVHENNSLLVCDATQAVGKMPINVEEQGIDVLCFSAHKFYGPKGIGCLYISHTNRSITIAPLIHGGGHEKGYRSGTLNVPAIIGLGEAAAISANEMLSDGQRIGELRDYLEENLLKIQGAKVNGNIANRLYNVTNIFFPNIEASVLIGRTKNIAFSNGSACSSIVIEPSHVLKSMGLSDEEAFSSIRFSLGRFNTLKEIEQAAEEVSQSIEILRSINHLG